MGSIRARARENGGGAAAGIVGRSGVVLALLFGVAASPSPTMAVASTGMPAPASTAITTPAAAPIVDLGRYAFNGPINAAVSDAATGITYVGGKFDRVGIRTGSVAVVDGPGDGTAALQPNSPDIIGDVTSVVADGDGYFVGGNIVAVNGTSTSGAKIVRIGATGNLDDWHVTEADGCGEMVDSRIIGSTGQWLIVGTMADTSHNTTGLRFVDRATGNAYGCGLWTGIPPLPELAACTDESVCYGVPTRAVLDEASGILLTTQYTIVGSPDGRWRYEVAAYDWNAGTRLWVVSASGDLKPGTPVNQDYVGSVAAAGGRVLVSGNFRLEGDPLDDHTTTLMLLDEATGSVLRRWNKLGEQSLTDPSGDPIAAAQACTSFASSPAPGFVAVSGSELIGFADSSWNSTADFHDFPVCRYTLAGGAVSASVIGTIRRDDAFNWQLPQSGWPSEPYTDSQGTKYLVGPFGALDVESGSAASWNPEPATQPGGGGPAVSVAIVGSQVVLGGAFKFIHGMPANYVAALGPDLAPIPSFGSQLGYGNDGVLALAIADDSLIAGGSFSLGERYLSIAVVDRASGALRSWTPAATAPNPVRAIAVDPASGAFYVGGLTNAFDANVAFQRYRPLAAGGALDTSFAPVLSCLDTKKGNDVVPIASCDPAGNSTNVDEITLVGDRVYIGGSFGGVDGEPRQGLARVDSSGAVDAWAPGLIDAMGISGSSRLWELFPRAIELIGNNVVVAGCFTHLDTNELGNLSVGAISPLLAFDATSGARVRPVDAPALPWFPSGGWRDSGYDVAVVDGKLYVALGDQGIGVFDAATLDFDADASAASFDAAWWQHQGDDGVFALTQSSAPGPAPAAKSGTVQPAAAARVETLVIAGLIPRWGNHTAGNVVSMATGQVITPAVVSFAPTVASPTSATSIPFRLTFNEPVTGLAAADFTIGGTSTGWSVKSVTGTGAGPYTVTIGGTATTAGSVTVGLKAASVADGASHSGPPTAVAAGTITVTRSVPGAPTGVKATPSNGAASVSWSAPASNGSNAIVSYTVTSLPGSKTCTTSGLTCTVTGLTNGQPYTFTVKAKNGIGVGPASSPSASVVPYAGATYVALTPNRLVDSRSGLGVGSRLTTGVARSFTVVNRTTAVATRVPANAVAVTGTLTVTGQTARGYLALTPSKPSGTPAISTVNFPAFDTRATGVTVPLGLDGSLWVTFVSPVAGSTAQVVFDVTGYFTAGSTGASYVTVTPNRIADSRSSLGVSRLAVGAANSHALQVTGRFPSDPARNVPSNAVAVTGTLTVTRQTAPGFVALTPVKPAAAPAISTLNFPLGDDRATGVTVPLSGGQVWLTFMSSTSTARTDVVFDVTGYFVPGTSGALYVPLTPNRIVDSRTGVGVSSKLVTGVPRSFGVTNRTADAATNVPSGAVAITGTLTVTGQTARGFFAVTPSKPSGTPAISTLNFPAADVRATGVTVPLNASGSLWVTFVSPTAGATAQVVFDVTGYFVK